MTRLNKIIIIALLIMGITVSISILPLKNENKEYIVTALPDSACNAQEKICRVDSDKFSLEIVYDKNIFYLKPFSVSVWTENNDGFGVESISIDFKMKNMDMGINRFKLSKEGSPIRNKQKWKGNALLPVCVSGRADWFSELEVATKQKKYILAFPILVRQTAN
ncbi:MAG: hypothetical protein OQK75_01470 [Gammaproteobacteria bacterium]|nr:hypothetical protein [Gammaproteobacteria bacterium]MCW8986315.1 hypothetical protein [Gammaproteobacteria bacterium]MCW9031311.1 hypothetical protein [Gammaproteobacteria bacterium]